MEKTATPETATEAFFVAGGPELAFRVGPITAEGPTTRAVMRTGAWNKGPDGQPSFGSLGVLVDDMLGYAIVRARPEGYWATSVELHVEFTDRIPPEGSAIHAESRAVALTPSTGLAQGRVFDESGRTIAVGSQRLRFIPGIPDALSGAAAGTAPPPTPDLRHSATLDQLDGALTRHGGGARLTVPVGPAVSNPLGTLHGGIMLCATEIVAHFAVRLAEHPLSTGSIHIAYLRPGPVEGEVTFEATTIHRGRSLAVVQVIGYNAQGKPCTFATSTSHAT